MSQAIGADLDMVAAEVVAAMHFFVLIRAYLRRLDGVRKRTQFPLTGARGGPAADFAAGCWSAVESAEMPAIVGVAAVVA